MLRSVAKEREQGAVPSDPTRSPGRHRQEPLPAPRSLICAALLALLSIACRSDGRTPLVIYSPHGRDLLTLLERRFEQLHPDVDVRWLDNGLAGGVRPAALRARQPAGGRVVRRPCDDLRARRARLAARAVPAQLGGGIAPHGRAPGDVYFAAYETPAVIVYAEQAVKPEQPLGIGRPPGPALEKARS